MRSGGFADSHFATLVSKTSAANDLSNPLEVRLSTGTTSVGITSDALDVNVANTVTVTGSVTVSATDLDIRNLSETTDQILVFANTAADGTGSDLVPLVDASGHLQVDVLSGGGGNDSVVVDDTAFTAATDSITLMGGAATSDSVDANDRGALRMLTNRALVTTIEDAGGDGISIVGSNLLVEPLQDTHDDLNCNATIQVGDADVANGNPVPVSDAGGSLTIDNATLAVVGGGVEATALRVTIASDSTGLLSVDDNGSSLTVDAVDLDIRNLNLTDDAVKISGNSSANTELNPVWVAVSDSTASGEEVQDYDTAAAVAGGATDNHDLAVAGSTFLLKSVIFSSSGGGRAEIQVGPIAALVSKAVVFIPKFGGTQQVEFSPAIEVSSASTGSIRVSRENREGSAQDLYSTIIGTDIA